MRGRGGGEGEGGGGEGELSTETWDFHISKIRDPKTCFQRFRVSIFQMWKNKNLMCETEVKEGKLT